MVSDHPKCPRLHRGINLAGHVHILLDSNRSGIKPVTLQTPADTFPYATNTTRAKQIDHTTPYNPTGPPGQSRIGNYGPMTVFHHRLKTHGGWQVAQPFPGIYLWRDPTGQATYLVDHTGTRRLAISPVRVPPRRPEAA
jgi:hypothetical protein